MAVFDVALGFELYQAALRQGLGQSLVLWEEPYQEGSGEPAPSANSDGRDTMLAGQTAEDQT
jgi:hypothetical protein